MNKINVVRVLIILSCMLTCAEWPNCDKNPFVYSPSQDLIARLKNIRQQIRPHRFLIGTLPVSVRTFPKYCTHIGHCIYTEFCIGQHVHTISPIACSRPSVSGSPSFPEPPRSRSLTLNRLIFRSPLFSFASTNWEPGTGRLILPWPASPRTRGTTAIVFRLNRTNLPCAALRFERKDSYLWRNYLWLAVTYGCVCSFSRHKFQ